MNNYRITAIDLLLKRGSMFWKRRLVRGSTDRRGQGFLQDLRSQAQKSLKWHKKIFTKSILSV